MSNGLRYETGRDMPPGMAEKAAVKIAQNLQQGAAYPSSVTAGAVTPSPEGEGFGERDPIPELAYQRDRLIEIIMTVPPIGPCIRGRAGGKGLFTAKHFADFFVANGVRLPRWIPVAERKPDTELKLWRENHPTEPLQVLVAIRGAREATILSYDEDGDFFAVDDYGDVDYCHVDYWQPVPAVPEVQK